MERRLPLPNSQNGTRASRVILERLHVDDEAVFHFALEQLEIGVGSGAPPWMDMGNCEVELLEGSHCIDLAENKGAMQTGGDETTRILAQSATVGFFAIRSMNADITLAAPWVTVP